MLKPFANISYLLNSRGVDFTKKGTDSNIDKLQVWQNKIQNLSVTRKVIKKK